MISRRQFIVVAALFVLVSVIAIPAVWYAQARSEFTLLNSWFDGNGGIELTGIELRGFRTTHVVTDKPSISSIDDAIHRKSLVSGPVGYQCNARVRLNGKWCFETVFCVLRDERRIVIGIPTEPGHVISDFRYAEITVDSQTASNLFHSIDAIRQKK